MDTRTHDYSVRTWGHDFGIDRVHDGVHLLDAHGWGSGIQPGDFLLLPNGDATTRYQVDRIDYQSDPPDMWVATLRFAPREGVTAAEGEG